MKEKDQFMETAGESFLYAKQYTEQQVEYMKLELAEKSSLVISSIITSFVQLTVIFFIIGLLTISLGFYLGNILGSMSQAFLILAGIYAFFMVILYLFRYQLITNPVLSLIISKIYNS